MLYNEEPTSSLKLAPRSQAASVIDLAYCLVLLSIQSHPASLIPLLPNLKSFHTMAVEAHLNLKVIISRNQRS